MLGQHGARQTQTESGVGLVRACAHEFKEEEEAAPIRTKQDGGSMTADTPVLPAN